MEWISVKDRLPEIGEHVLVFANDIVSSWVEIAWMDKSDWHTSSDYEWPCLVDFWMPLPESPKD